jgi:Glycosyltransferase family 10 (fucosyltransferase) C-term
MKKLKITLDDVGVDIDFNQYLPKKSRIIGDWEIFFNAETDDADAWFVIENVPRIDNCVVPKNMVFFGTAETSWPIGYYSDSYWRTAFLNQFESVYTCHDFFSTKRISSMPFLGWMVNSNHGVSMGETSSRDYDYFVSMAPPKKIKTLSVICSNQNWIPGHRMRLNFLNFLKTYADFEFDWFGNGFQTIPEKWQGLADYKYTLVLENQIKTDLVTEKFFDPLLTYTYPIYFGAPNIGNYFPIQSYSVIDIADPIQAMKTISKVINGGTWEKSQNALFDARNLYLNEYHPFLRILSIVDRKYKNKSESQKTKVTLKPIKSFQNKKEQNYEKIISELHKFATKIRRLF